MMATTPRATRSRLLSIVLKLSNKSAKMAPMPVTCCSLNPVTVADCSRMAVITAGRAGLSLASGVAIVSAANVMGSKTAWPS